jgi:hypothetical protein
MKDCVRLLSAPSTRFSFSRKCRIMADHSRFFDSTRALPITMSPRRARVMATFRRRGSARKPMPLRQS